MSLLLIWAGIYTGGVILHAIELSIKESATKRK